MTDSNNPISQLNTLIPCLRKVVKGFRDNGGYWLKLHFYQGGLRAPRIVDAGDKRKIKKELGNFLQAWGKPYYTGQIEFYLKHAEFTDNFNAFPGVGSLDMHGKEGIMLQVGSFFDEIEGEYLYRINELGDIKGECPF